MADGPGFQPSAYLENGQIAYAKLVGALLGAGWLTVAGGLIALQRAVVSVQIRLLETTQRSYVLLIRAVTGGGARLSRQSWAEAYEAAVATSPILAPLTLVAEIVLVSAIVLYFQRRVI